MDQVYVISSAADDGETRNLIYRYGRFVYSGPVITEPVLGLEYLPGVLQGIQAVQGQIPYISEVRELPGDSPQSRGLAYLGRAIDIIYEELQRLEPRLATVATEGNSWLEADDATVYFEFEALPGYTCNGSDVVFAKTFRGEVMLTVIWYAATGCFYVTLTPAGGEEQALVDTLFPAIYGKRRGVELHSYDSTSAGAYDEGSDEAYCAYFARKNAADVEGKSGFDGSAGLKAALDPATLLCRVSVWESDGEVPDPDAIRARDEAAMEDGEDEEGKDAEDEDGDAAGGVGATTVDVSGGNGYCQVYVVMQPAPQGGRTLLPGGQGQLTPRQALFRFGSWVYGGQVAFPVDTLRLGDVPYVLPALQKQQGRLGYIGEATTFPASHPLCPVITSFMAAVGILKQEMEDAQNEVAALAEQSVNAWIDAEWAASFFELSFQPGSVHGEPAGRSGATSGGAGLAGAEVIACKIYMFEGQGVILHCVWFNGSLYCVLADSVEDLPLLDVAFPDVTARNRVVQVRSYEERTARKLSEAFPGAPLPKALRVWEGRRRGVPGVGFGAAAAITGADGAAEAIRQKARERAERESAAGAASSSSGAGSARGTAATDSKVAEPAKSSASDSKTSSSFAQKRRHDNAGSAGDDDDDGDDLYDVQGLKQSLAAAAASGKPASSSSSSAAAAKPALSSSSSSSAGGGGAASMPTQLFNSVARAPHHVAPLNRAGPSSSAGGGGRGGAAAGGDDDDSFTATGNRLILVGGSSGSKAATGGGGSDNKDEEAPWDASGKPRARR